MSGPADRTFDLIPLRDASIRDERFVAATTEPWLLLVTPAVASLRGHFVELTYRASLWDEPCRPIIRFRLVDGTFIDRIAPGPIVNCGIWTGRVPSDTVQIEISPTNRIGPFDFRVERLRKRVWSSVLATGWSRHPKPTRSAVLTKLIGWAPESDVNLAWAIGAEPMHSFARWRSRRTRPTESDGIDRPRFDWDRGETISFFVRDGDPARVRESIAGLQSQIYPRWVASVPRTAESLADARLRPRPEMAGISGLCCVLDAGDILTPLALAHVAEQSRRYPSCRLFYGDQLTDSSAEIRPVFQPGWCPRWQAGRPYLHAPLFVRDAADWEAGDRDAWLATGILPPSFLDGLGASDVITLRRFLSTRSPVRAPDRLAPAAVCSAATAHITVVIPTRDHPVLLQRIVESVRSQERHGALDIVIVDNGSVASETLALLDTLAAEDDVQRIDRPGPFNFSAMCNAAAHGAFGDVLVFLNDDTELLSNDALLRLAALAMDGSIGAVGAKLTYPDGRVQHVGVLVGMGESAAHFGSLAEGTDPGWHGWNDTLHEVSAVTGACLAVARSKFESVGGFDAEHLPVELSDIDLCLKLNARGWQTVVEPAVRVMHEESVSRGGATFRRLGVYAEQRRVFAERWRHVMRDDPVFHPGLSLYSSKAALG